MSPLWRDEVQLLLTPRRVALRRRARGLRPVLVQAAQSDLAHGQDLHWSAPLDALAALLRSAAARGADATVVLSSHFVRHSLVPESELLVTHDDALRFARHNFMRIHGAAAERWSVRVSEGDGAEGGSGLASGVEQELVDALRALLVAHGLRPRALQPLLMAAFNQARPLLPKGGCRLVVLEPDIAVSALLQPGWRRVHSQRLAGPAADELQRLIERERLQDDEPPAGHVTCVLPLQPLPQPVPEAADLRVLAPLWPDAQPAGVARARRGAKAADTGGAAT